MLTMAKTTTTAVTIAICHRCKANAFRASAMLSTSFRCEYRA